MKKLLSTTGTIISRITVLAAFIMVVGIGNLLAEEYAVSEFNLGKEGTAVEYRTKFNTDHGKYVTIAINNENSSKTFSVNGYISPTGASRNRIGTMGIIPVYDYRGTVTLTPASGCYLMDYRTYLGTERLSETLEGYGYDYHAAVNVGTELSSKFENIGHWYSPKYSITWTNAQYTKNSSGNDALIRGSHKQSTPLVFNAGYFAVSVGTEFPSNRPYLKDLSTTIWVPEVSPGEDEVSMSLVKAANTSSEVVTKTYKVQHSMALGDFKYEFKNLEGEGGAAMKGSLKFVNTPSYDATNQTLTVTFQYVSASGANFAENYTADLVISSNNEVNTNVWTTHINGSAGDRAQNNLRWNLQEPYYVNSLIEDPTFFDSDAEIIYGTSDAAIAEFEDVDSDGIKELRLLKSGIVTLSARQDANTNYFGKELDDITITVVKRTPEFVFNPIGDLYTSRTYTQYISPKLGVDPNGTMNPTYTSEDVNLFTVNDAGDVKTMAGEATKNLHVSVTPTDEWNGFEKDYPITIVRDIMHVPFCIDNQARYDRLEINTWQKSWSNSNGGTITIGTPEQDVSRTSTIIINISGTPDKLRIGNVTNSASGSLNAYVQVQGSSGRIWLGQVTAGKEFSLDSKVYAIQIEYVGKRTASISGICITEKVDVTYTPEQITLMKLNNVISPVDLDVEYSNMTDGSMEIAAGSLAANLFTISCDGHTPTHRIDLTYTDGLGVDQSPTIQVSVAYTGNPNDIDIATIVNPVAYINVEGTNGDVTITKQVAINIDGIEVNEHGVPIVIVDANSEHTGIWTGTEGTSTTFPYKPKVEVNVSSAFSATGSPLFDYLYIFGLTTDQSGGNNINAANPFNPSRTCNAKTPLYMYVKDGAGYRLDPENVFDAVSKRFDHGTSMNGKKLYITGYCPFAYIGGTSASEEGWMYFQGGDEQVDIYLDNCQIMGRNRSSDGSRNYAKYPVNNVVINVTGITGENKNFMQGFSSIFVFNSTSANRQNAYKPTIHIRGNNHLKGQLGYITQVKAALFGSELDLDMLKSYKNIPTCNSPITIKPDANGGFTSLTLDDIWPVDTYTKEITNGYLQLDSYGYDSHEGKMPTRAPSIDLGSEYGMLTINGGQYHVHNSTSKDGQYTNNMTFGHRKFLKEATVASITAVLSLYGFGGDMTTNTVIINSGTFTMFKNLIVGGNYYLDQEKYLDLRLPIGTEGNYSRINGGTFNNISNVVFCSQVTSSGQSPVNEFGEWLVLKDVVTSGTTSYGSATFDIPDPFDIYDDPQVTYNLVSDLDKVAGGELYGGQSANAYTKEGNQIVSLLLSGAQCEGTGGCEQIEEALYVNWITTLPKIGLTISGVEASIGGEKEVPINVALTEKISMDYVVNQLMYIDLDGMQTYPVNDGDLQFTYEEQNTPYGGITNAESYKIYKNLNILKAVEADRWYAFTAPFDIDMVSVLETEEASVSALKNRNDAKKKQAEVNAKFLLDTYVMFYPFSDLRSSPYTFREIVTMFKRSLTPLNHYNGTNAADGNHGTNLYNAHYYLYELATKEFPTDGTGDALDIQWVPVKRDAGEPLMYAGRTYAVQFPYCPMCNDLATRTYNDYWTNKIIHFYGDAKPGGTTIQGADFHSTILGTTPAVDYATLAGNSTFAKMTLPASAGYVHNTSNDFFEKNNSAVTIKPTQGYMVYGGGAKGMPERISRSGKMIFGDNTTTDLEGVPTIGDRTSIMLFDAMDGFEVLSLCEQLVMVYNLQGNLIFRQQMAEGEQVHIAAAEGIYVVKGEKEAIKIMVD